MKAFGLLSIGQRFCYHQLWFIKVSYTQARQAMQPTLMMFSRDEEVAVV